MVQPDLFLSRLITLDVAPYSWRANTVEVGVPFQYFQVLPIAHNMIVYGRIGQSDKLAEVRAYQGLTVDLPVPLDALYIEVDNTPNTRWDASQPYHDQLTVIFGSEPFAIRVVDSYSEEGPEILQTNIILQDILYDHVSESVYLVKQDFANTKLQAIESEMYVDATRQDYANVRLEAANVKHDYANVRLDAANVIGDRHTARLDDIKTKLDAVNVKLDTATGKLTTIDQYVYGLRYSPGTVNTGVVVVPGNGVAVQIIPPRLRRRVLISEPYAAGTAEIRIGTTGPNASSGPSTFQSQPPLELFTSDQITATQIAASGVNTTVRYWEEL